MSAAFGDSGAKCVELLQEVMPAIKRIGFLGNPVSELCQNHWILSGAIGNRPRRECEQEPEILPDGVR